MNRKAKILIVDDEQMVRDELKDILTEEGYIVVDAKDGYDAVEKVKEQDFDLIVSDLKMPGLNGFETLRKIQEIKPKLRAIMLTGFATVDTISESAELGIYDYVTKSAIDQLRATVKKVLQSGDKSKTAEEETNPAKVSRAGLELYSQCADDLAAAYWENAARIYKNMKRWELAAVNLGKTGYAYESNGYPERAKKAYQEAAELYRKVGNDEKAKDFEALVKQLD